ncbi:MAG: Vi polysaccharide biosynthesis UDP-N-acetylglucosamine C-6 dehydrogenase TviB, partial [Alphaproteobacteria bacterium]|nr:Vi polysaccharide biosynthesis UDP-N-acetylglucosamine C-6 dehydrogenase TviB [Alphaproteobacteria bacterium]
MNLSNRRIAVIGLGYVGLPLAVEFAKRGEVIGFDISDTRIRELRAGHDTTFETTAAELGAAKNLEFTSSSAALESCTVFIITVPTPIDGAKR